MKRVRFLKKCVGPGFGWADVGHVLDLPQWQADHLIHHALAEAAPGATPGPPAPPGPAVACSAAPISPQESCDPTREGVAKGEAP